MRKVQNKLDERLNYIRSLILDMGGFVEQTISSSSDIYEGAGRSGGKNQQPSVKGVTGVF